MKPEHNKGYNGPIEINYNKPTKQEIKFDPNIPDSITIEGQLKCPRCGFPVTDKVGYMVAGGASRSKYHCRICGYNFGD